MFIRKFAFLFSEAVVDPPAGGGGGGAVTPPAEAPVYFKPDGTFGENWHAGLGDEFTPHAPTLTNFKDVKSLAKSYVNLRSHGPSYPTEQSAPEDIDRFHALAQVPVNASPEAYGITIPDGLPDNAKKSYERVLAAAHKHHASGPAVKAIVEEFQAAQAEEYAFYEDQVNADRQAKQDALVGEWRGNFESNMGTVRHWAGKLAEQAGIDPSDEEYQAMQSHPAFAKVMLQVSKLASEDNIRLPHNIGDLRSPQQQADAIMDGTDPVWGKKYTEGTTQEKQEAYQAVVKLLAPKK